MLDAELLEQFQLLMAMIQDTRDEIKRSENRLVARFTAMNQDTKSSLTARLEDTKSSLIAMMEEKESTLREEIRQSEARTRVFIENNVTRRLDSLFDGYQLVYEKQAEQDGKQRAMEDDMDDVKVRLTVLEQNAV